MKLIDKYLKTDDVEILEEGFSASMAKCALLTGGIFSKYKCQIPVYSKYIGELTKQMSQAGSPEKKQKIKTKIEYMKGRLDRAKKKASGSRKLDPKKKVF